MRIAVSGTHRVGKTTLAGMLAETLGGYELIPEPYYLLLEDGAMVGDMPSIEDFESQLERSLQCIRESGTDVVFDRCPLDVIGYLRTHPDADMFHIEQWFQDIREAIAILDLVVFVPIEVPDRIDIPFAEASYRDSVDTVLRDIIVDDEYGLEMQVLSVEGAPEDRFRQVLASLQ